MASSSGGKGGKASARDGDDPGYGVGGGMGSGPMGSGMAMLCLPVDVIIFYKEPLGMIGKYFRVTNINAWMKMEIKTF